MVIKYKNMEYLRSYKFMCVGTMDLVLWWREDYIVIYELDLALKYNKHFILFEGNLSFGERMLFCKFKTLALL